MTVNGVKIKLEQFADDLWTPMLFDQNSLDAMMLELQDFEKAMGLAINYNKTEILRIGSLRNSDAQLYSDQALQWTNEKI